ncbi:MAG: CapA family protein [Christensenellaceae bacterium]|nr:CapA family protein [Christensenellaceae bacterium]MEA5066356.1 CapA family protein [Eubacteriales bacterium]MEA5067736.1 CapA family protein [Christensenellaceae bacterium]
MQHDTARRHPGLSPSLAGLAALIACALLLPIMGMAEPLPSPTPNVNGEMTFSISAVGDCTLGGDPRKGSKAAFDRAFERLSGDYAYYFREVAELFAEDDLTIANLEGALTQRKKFRKGEIFVFRGDPEYAKILSAGGIDAVTLANNHAIDFLEGGLRDTREALDSEGIAHFGFDDTAIVEVKGVKIGLCGFTTWRSDFKQIERVVGDLAASCDLVIASFHWGEENVGKATKRQVKLGRFAIDAGADLVLGHHPHVVGGIETYKGKRIVYSLANFCFGGNRRLRDRDSFVYRQRYRVAGGEVTDDGYEIIPCLTATGKEGNNYQPAPATGKDAERILKRIKKLSPK